MATGKQSIAFEGHFSRNRFVAINRRILPVFRLMSVGFLMAFILYFSSTGTTLERIETEVFALVGLGVLGLIVASIQRAMLNATWRDTTYLSRPIGGNVGTRGFFWQTGEGEQHFVWADLRSTRRYKDFFIAELRRDRLNENTRSWSTMWFPVEFFASHTDWQRASEIMKLNVPTSKRQYLAALPLLFVLLYAAIDAFGVATSATTKISDAAAYLKVDNPAKAVAILDKVLAKDPNNLGALIDRGLAYEREQKFDPALRDFDHAVAVAPKNPLVLNDRGKLHSDRLEFGAAIKDLDQAIGLKSDYAEAYLNRGLAYASEGDTEHASTDLNEAIRLKPADRRILAGRNTIFCGLHVKAGQFGVAASECARAIELEPGIPDIYLYAGILEFLGPDFAKAPATLAKALKLEPTDAYTAMWLHLARMRNKQNDDAEFTANAGRVNPQQFASKIIGFYRDELTADQVFAIAAEGDEATQIDHQCDANFFIGQFYLLSDRKEEGNQLLTVAAADCGPNTVEKVVARARE
jgi:Tfp pilus assembly protein PilF